MKRFHIKAWGSDKYPDLDFEADEVDEIIRWNYPCLNIAMQYAVPCSAIMAELNSKVRKAP